MEHIRIPRLLLNDFMYNDTFDPIRVGDKVLRKVTKSLDQDQAEKVGSCPFVQPPGTQWAWLAWLQGSPYHVEARDLQGFHHESGRLGCTVWFRLLPRERIQDSYAKPLSPPVCSFIVLLCSISYSIGRFDFDLSVPRVPNKCHRPTAHTCK